MMNKSKMTRFLTLSLAIAAFVLVSGSFTQIRHNATRFKKSSG